MTRKKKRKQMQQRAPELEPEIQAETPEATPATPILASRHVRVGDVVLRKPLTISPSADKDGARVLRGTVVWVHPKGRFHVVEFGEGASAVRESFAGVER